MAVDDGLDWFHHPEEFTMLDYRTKLIQEVTRLRAALTEAEERGKQKGRRELYERVPLLNAKWLDPECVNSCQSLIYKRRAEEAEERGKLAERARIRAKLADPSEEMVEAVAIAYRAEGPRCDYIDEARAFFRALAATLEDKDG